MSQAPLVQSPALLRDLHAFLALEAPFLAAKLPEDLPAHELEELLLARAVARWQGAAPRWSDDQLWPGTTQATAARWSLEALQELLRGFFRRQEIKAAITDAERLQLYRTMALTRAIDDFLKRAFDRKAIRWGEFPSPQKGFRSTGQEAIAGAALRLRRPPQATPGPGYDGDVIAPLIRDLGATLMFRPDALHPILVQYGKKGTTVDGRDLHVGDLDWGVLPPAAPLTIATQTLLGIAYAWKLRDEPAGRVAVSFIGDGGASLGEWHETINFAAVQRLAMVFVIENNQWALGTHVSEQSAARRFALRAPGYGIPGVTLFGNDPEEVAAGVGWAAERARAGRGPSLVELVTYRRTGHAHHDDDRFFGNAEAKIPGYEHEEERRRWEAADPLALYEERLRELGVASAEQLAQLRAEAAAAVEAAGVAAEAAPWPTPEDYRQRVYAPRREPLPLPPAAPRTRVMAYDEAVRQGISEAMAADQRVFVLGEDVGGRYGGAFGVTRGLAKSFGERRCVNTPLAESAIVGCAVGAAIGGLRPIVEMQFADFLATGFNALVNNAAKVYWRWGRPVPMVVRLPYGGATGTGERLLGGGPYHSQCPEMWFLRTPGWKIVAPSTPADAKGLMLAAIRDDNPVLFLEAKGLYGFFRTDLREEVPLGPEHEVEIGRAAVRRAGGDLTILTYGAMVWTSLAAAERLAAEHGIEAEVIDLRTLWPLDLDTLRASVAKTHRVLTVHEDTRRGGLAGELAAIFADELFWQLDAPLRRVTAPDTPIPYSPPLEHDFLPNAEDVVAAARRLAGE
ncbi:MAG TPA: thiamine pyrophosphate-dependent enzyme [Thermoanaerobaculia bacterium]|jgi:pyruvate/2-oxoglutarate/acetoin dehydrogenase E1 component/TPP-dependent pyruvate/acetoin dehydrogenase alpha subunit|nr:thiamine pyrophosphate-dependent enzyme [Thermoanaerobaculia bacterium]